MPKTLNASFKYFNELEMAGHINENGEYIKGIEDHLNPAQYNNQKHRDAVVSNILENWNRISYNNEFSAILATSSIPEAIEYYRLFKQKGTINRFKFTVLVDPNIDNNEGAIFKEDGLVEIINDYNNMFEQRFSLSTSSAFKKDVSNRLAHKKPYTMIKDSDKLG